MTFSFTIPGAPRTKKTHNRIFRAGNRIRVMPSKQYEDWDRAAQLWLCKVRADATENLPIKTPVRCTALFYRERNSGDLTGFEQALADTLQHGRIIVNDRLIHSWDGSMLLKDAKKPRVEVTLETV